MDLEVTKFLFEHQIPSSTLVLIEFLRQSSIQQDLRQYQGTGMMESDFTKRQMMVRSTQLQILPCSRCLTLLSGCGERALI